MENKLEKQEVWKTNHFLNVKIRFSLVQLRIVHFMYSKIQEYVYAAANKQQVSDLELTLYEDAYLNIPMSMIDKGNQKHRNIYNAFRGLKELDISKQNTSVESFILSAHRKDNYWRVLIPRTTFKFMLEKAEKGVTALENILYMSATSGYTVKIYEQLKQRSDLIKWYTNPLDFAELVGAPQSARKNFGKLREDIIDPAKEELRELYEGNRSAICFDYEYKRAGRGGKVVELNFVIYTRKQDTPRQKKEQSAKDMEYISFTLQKMMLEGKMTKAQRKKNEEFINKALSKLTDTAQLGNFAKTLEKARQKAEAKGEDPDKKGGLARYILEYEFDIEP